MRSPLLFPWLLLAATLVAACGGGSSLEGADRPAPHTEDAGLFDGSEAQPDAGEVLDAGGETIFDAGETFDAGQVFDAGEAVDAGEGTDAGQGLELEALLPALVDAVCTLRVRCEFVEAIETCRAELAGGHGTTWNTLRALVDSVQAGQVTLDPVGARVCVERIATLNCGAAKNALPELPECAGAFGGTVAEGGRCIHRAACVQGTFCRRASSAGCEGLCVAVAEEPCACGGPYGDPFSDLCSFGDVCRLGSGTVCDGAPSTRCEEAAAAGAEGESCRGLGLCLEGLGCSGGSCVPLASEGCSPLVGCPAPGQVCVFTSGSTTGCLDDKAEGEACAFPMECGGFTSPAVCDLEALQCVARPGPGEPCATAVPGSPMGFCDEKLAWCDQSAAPPVCRAYLALGETCREKAECGSLTGDVGCDSATGRCVQLPLEVCAP